MKKFKRVLCYVMALCMVLQLCITNSFVAEASDSSTTITAHKVMKAPSMGIITEASWGAPVIKVDKNSDNATLYGHNATPDDTNMEIYTLWDAENLYLGVISDETDVRGNENSWEGDGLQFKLSAGETMSAEAANIYFSLDEDGTSVVVGGTPIKDCNIVVKDGKMHATAVIPFEALGMISSDVKADAKLSFSILRISGTAEHVYAGWLAWGAFFGAGNSYHENCYTDNLIVLSDETVAQSTVINAKSVTKAPSLDVITTAGWGTPVITVDKNSDNSTLYAHNATPDDTNMEIYTVWDAENLYLGVISDETDVRGNENSWEGDGLQFKLSAGETMSSEAANIYFSLDEDGTSVVVGGTPIKDCNIVVKDGKMHATAAIPFEALGMVASDIKADAKLSFSILRISGTAEHVYAGWLAWGAFFGVGHNYHANCYTDNLIVLSDEAVAQSTVINAKSVSKAPSLDVITSAAWGEPVIKVDKNSDNATLYAHNATPDDTNMEIYTVWDAENLYLGVISDETDVRGNENSWEGDGLQFKLSAGETMSSEAANIYFSLDEDGTSVVVGGTPIKDCNIVVKDGKMHATAAIPFEALGMVASDIKADAKLSFSILRISGTAEHVYAGWLAWGAFFGAGHNYHANCYTDNLIVLSGETIAQSTVISAPAVHKAPSLGIITEAGWGTPAITVDKNSDNATLYAHNATPDDTNMEIYTLWDAENLYLGVISDETDVRGNENSWEGDGLQFKLSAGETMASEAANIYFTLDEDGTSVLVGGTPIKDCNIIVEDGKMHATAAIPFEALGMVASDIKADAKLSFSILRISGTAEHVYAGWLAWGAFFGVGHNYHANCYTDNLIVLSDEAIKQSTVIEANKTTTAPSLDVITEAVWGTPAITVDKNSDNATLYAHNATPDDTNMEIYTLWDAENLYLGVISDENDVRGNENSWEGDGLQFKLSAGETMASEAANIYFTLDEDGTSVVVGGTPIKDCNIVVKDGKMHATAAIPFEALGMVASDIKADAKLSFSILRISGTADHVYAGWLAWGAFFGVGHNYHANCYTDNLIVLSDPNAGEGSGGEEEFVSKLVNIPQTSGTYNKGNEASFVRGNKAVATEDGTLFVYQSVSEIAQSADYEGISMMNEYAVQLIKEDGTVQEVAYGYSNHGTVDLVADAAGNVYVVGGSASDEDWAFFGESADSATKFARLSVEKYNGPGTVVDGQRTTGAMTGFMKQLDFINQSVVGYEFMTTAIDQTAGLIYIFFEGTTENGASIEYFTFNVNDKSWAQGAQWDVSVVPESAYAVVVDGAPIVVYGSDDTVAMIKGDTESIIGEGLQLADVLLRANDDVLALAKAESIYKLVTISGEAISTADTAIDSAKEVIMTEKNGALYAMASNTDAAVEVTVYSDNGEYTTLLDQAIQFHAAPITVRANNGSDVISDELLFAFVGLRGKFTYWYYAELPMTNVTP